MHNMAGRSDSFYKTVSDYYDQDADLGFEARAESNPLLERIRNDFRKVTEKYPFSNALEIGCGPGFDVAWFASKYPEKKFTAVDISEKMADLAATRVKEQGLANATVLQSDERTLAEKFGAGSFDLVYVFFGALNTVADLHLAAREIEKLLTPGGHAVLTFVNKWYLREMIVQTLKLKPSIALARLKREWGGYSVDRHLPSKCYSPRQIRKAFKSFDLLEKKGYSIFFPAWYNPHKVKGQPEKADRLWEKDRRIQGTFLWSKGEYTLFVFKR